MAFAQSIDVAVSDWTCLNLEYLYNNRALYDNVFSTNVGSATNFEYSVSGVESIDLSDSTLLLLRAPSQQYNQQTNIYPANQQDVLSGASFSDFSTSNTVISSQLISGQDIVSIPLANEDNVFNIFTLHPKEGQYFYAVRAGEDDTTISLSEYQETHNYTFLPDVPQKFFMEISGTPNTIFSNGYAGESYCESDYIKMDNDVFWLSGDTCNHQWVKTYFMGTNKVSSVFVGNSAVSGEGEYFRMGNLANETVRNTIDNRLAITAFFLSAEEVTFNGYPSQVDYFDMNGSDYIQVDWDDPEDVYENEIKTNWSFSCLFRHKSIGGQVIGNRNPDKTSGFSFEFNTGFNSFQKTIPFGDRVLTLNENNLKVGSKVFVDANFTLIASGPTGSGIRWLYDSTNKVIHKLLGDDFSSTRIDLRSDADVLHMETDYQNNLWMMDGANRRFQSYDPSGHLQKTLPFAYYGTTQWDHFYLPILGTTPYPTFAKITDFDSSGNLYKLCGQNIRKNEVLFYSFGSKVHDFYIDLQNRLWVFFDKNQMCVIDCSTGDMIGSKIVILGIDDETNARISGWSNSKGIFTTQILLMDNGIVMEMDENMTIVKKSDVEITCERGFSDTFRGDWCGFKLGKRQNYMSQTLYTGFANLENPFLTLDFSYYCVDGIDEPTQHGIFRMHAPYKQNTRFEDWNGIGFVVNNFKGTASIFINGNVEKVSTFPPMSRLVRHEYPDNNRYNPIFIGAYNGKIGTKDQYTGTESNGIIGDIAQIHVYSQALSNGNISTIFRDDYFQITGKSLFNSLNVGIPTKRIQNITMLSKFLKNSLPGMQSNFFDLNVYGFSETDEVKAVVEARLIEEVERVIPAHVELRQINWK